MARRQGAQRSDGQDVQDAAEVRDDRSTGRSNSEAEAVRGAGAAGAPDSQQRGDRQRQVEMSREGGSSAMQSGGTGAQSPSRQSGRGGALSGRGQAQPSILPALMANPGLLTRAFMANPFAFADAMNQEMDRLFSMTGGDLNTPVRQSGGGAGRGRGMTQWIPAMEVRQRENEIVVHADLPGLTPDDVQIELENGVLTISGERRDSSEDRNEGYIRSERSYGAFSRSVALPEGVDEDQVNARFEHGVLEVTVPLPRQQEQSRRRVPINAGGQRQAGQDRASQPQSQAQSQPQSQPQRGQTS